MRNHDWLATLWRSNRTAVPRLTLTRAVSGRKIAPNMAGVVGRLEQGVRLAIRRMLSVSGMWSCCRPFVHKCPGLLNPSMTVPRRGRSNIQLCQVLMQTSFPRVLTSAVICIERSQVDRA